ncbi:serine hydrolase [Streptomyces sp. BK239]|uniref:serine hydrolase n=1 Tax=Streptomyces sp. BK239 TaxID=2512155 RepID=UPI0010EC9016|nr:serine hydrolase [Streptomyces sp. BK239]RZU15128.1 D-alanyl-D-alanine carboxypeptidase [Streptomyces sp. BK239]
MAGESPDKSKSKQRESSAEPTSGSAGAVPEARDPRVAAARDGEASSSSSAARGGVDTATRVFSVRELKTDEDRQEEPGEPEESAEEASEAAEGSTEKAGASDGASGGSGSGDERLRAAVAQWVSSADEKTAGKAPESTKDAKDAKEADGTEESSEAEKESEKDSEAKPAAKSAPKWAAKDDAKTEDETDDAKAEDEAPEGGETSEDDEPEAGKADDAPENDTDAEDAKSPEAAEDDEDADTDAPVDQPTAIFKMPSAKPAVDQPTTMLKLGGDATEPASGAKKDAKKPATDKPKADADKPKAADGEAEPDPTPAPERTSKFVALKPLDDPSTRKPPTAAPAEPKPAPAEPDAKTTAKPEAKPAAKPSPQPTTEPSKPAADATAVVPQIGPERTTQQPLPPKPPLDLLAELTNTPPPPPTPLRTLGRRVKIWTPLFVLLVIVFAIAQAVRPLPAPALALTAKETYTFEGGKLTLPWPGEGQGSMDVTGIGTMSGFGDQKPVAIGSVAKAMTAYVVLKDHTLKSGEEGPAITVDPTAEKEGGYDVSGGESTLNTVKAGDKLTLRQALSAVMIPSANNIARLLARWDAGNEAAFIAKMNATAKRLGMTNTTYTDASGLKETTVSTAADQVKLGNELVKIPSLVEITKLPKWFDPTGKEWRNYNTLVPFNNAIGLKTGSTSKAGGNLLFAATKEAGGKTVTLVGAVLGQHTAPIIDTVNAVSKTALLAAQDAMTSAKILKKGDVVGYVDDKMGHHTPVVATEDVSAVGWAGLTVKLSFAPGEVPHTAKAGTQVGTLTVGDGVSGAVKVPVALKSELAEPGFLDKLTRVS